MMKEKGDFLLCLVSIFTVFLLFGSFYDHFSNGFYDNSERIRFLAFGKISICSCEKSSVNVGRSYENTFVDISSCFFQRQSTFSGQGGVIFINNGQSLLVYNSMFYNCHCSADGGAILSNSESLMVKMVCANKCSASTHGHFAYLSASLGNFVEYLSVTCCSPSATGYDSFCMALGDQRVDNTNCSMNNAFQYSGVLVHSPSSFSSSHCTFSHNKASHSVCVLFEKKSGLMSFANIVNNNSPAGNGVIYVYDLGTYSMKYCIFDYNSNALFYVQSGTLSIYHSFISHSGISSNTNNNSLIRFPTYQQLFFKSGYCHAEFPVILKLNTGNNINDNRNSRFINVLLLSCIAIL